MPRDFKKSSGFTDELMAVVRQHYLECAVEPTVEQLARNSVGLFGQSIPMETLKDWKRNDRTGDWSHQWKILHPETFEDELENVRQRLYGILMDKRTPAAVVSSAAKAWQELSAKRTGRSARTSHDQADVITRNVMKRLKEEGAVVGRPKLD